jgi:hypothetical protein
MTMAWISRNAIYSNGQKIERCFAGGSCDPDIRKGGIVFGLPSGEHERFGKRGIGVAPAPGSLAKICPDSAPNCRGAASSINRSNRRSGPDGNGRGDHKIGLGDDLGDRDRSAKRRGHCRAQGAASLLGVT